MSPALDYSNDLRWLLAEGRALDEALAELRRAGASIFDCIVSIRKFRKCEISEAKQIVEASAAWSDHYNVTHEFLETWRMANDLARS